MPPGVKSLMASQVGSWPSFTSISFMSLRGTAGQRQRHRNKAGSGGEEPGGGRGHLGGPRHSPGTGAILSLRRGEAGTGR